MKWKVMTQQEARQRGFSADKRKRRREHRQAARALIHGGTLFNARAPIGSIPWEVSRWHLWQARHVGR